MARRRIAALFTPSIGEMLFLCIFLRTLYLGGQLLNDGDTGWHIAAGDDMLKSFSIPHADTYSHTMPGAPWTAHEWLSEIIFSLLHRVMGLNGVVLLSAAVISLTMFFLYKFMVYRKVNPLIAALMTVLAASASGGHWLARPHVFSFIFTLAFVVILELYQREGINRLFYLPLLMLFWVNLHAGFILGLILIFIYACGNIIAALKSQEGREKARHNLRALGLVLLATMVAASVNPHGPALLLFPLRSGNPGFINSIKEWAAPDFHAERPFEFMLLIFIAIFVASGKKPDFSEGASALLLTHMSLGAVRFIPLLAIVATPMAAVRAGEVLGSFSDNLSALGMAKPKGAFERVAGNIASLETRLGGFFWVYAPIIFLFVIGLNGGKISGYRVMDYRFSDKTFPVNAVDFTLKNDIKGNMFNSYGWGGYIIYRCHPRYKVFVDGRIEPYGPSFLKEYSKVEWAEPGFERVLDKYNVAWVIDGADSPLVRALTIRGGWKAVYADKTAEILLRSTPENR